MQSGADAVESASRIGALNHYEDRISIMAADRAYCLCYRSKSEPHSLRARPW